jgi:hypothetical protein
VLLGSAGALLLAACGNDAETSGSTAPTAGTVSLVAPTPPERFLAAGGPQRTPLILVAGGPPLADPPGSLTVEVLYGGPMGAVEADLEPVEGGGKLELHDEDIPRPYYALRFTPEQSGYYVVRAEYNGKTLETTLQVDDPERVPMPQIGEPMIPLQTPTPDDHRDVEPICTLEPACPLHDVTLEQALGSGKPVAFLISTPAYCQTAICGPVLDLLIAEAEGRDLVALHAEVWKDAAALDGNIATATATEALEAYGLVEASYEPSLFIADAGGVVRSRLDLLYDRAELASSLDEVS